MDQVMESLMDPAVRRRLANEEREAVRRDMRDEQEQINRMSRLQKRQRNAEWREGSKAHSGLKSRV